jgi:hypothetical protein
MVAGQTINIPVVVDSADFHVLNTDNNPIQLQLDIGPGQTQILGSATLKNGKAVFRHIRLTQAGGYTLEAITEGASTSPTIFDVLSAPASTATLEYANYDPNLGYEVINVRLTDKFGNWATNDFSYIYLGPTQPLHAPVRIVTNYPGGNSKHNIFTYRGHTAVWDGGTSLFEFYLQNLSPSSQSASVKLVFSNHRLKPIWSPAIPGAIL